MNYFTLFLFFILCCLHIDLFSQTKSYIAKYQKIADSLGAIYEIPSSVILGVAIVESSSGTSKNCKLLNNHFGISGKNSLKKFKNIRSRYKQYLNSTSSYISFCKLITRRKFYPKLKGNTNYFLWVDAISKSKYSEFPTLWKERVISQIIKNKL